MEGLTKLQRDRLPMLVGNFVIELKRKGVEDSIKTAKYILQMYRKR